MDSSRNGFLNELWAQFSFVHTLERIIAWIFRFYDRLKFKQNSTSTILTSQELRTSKLRLIKLSQAQDFPEISTYIHQNKVIPTSHPLHKLLPTLQDDVIYLGLAVAYYSDSEGTVGGIGTPAEGKWSWEERNDLAPAIRDSLLYYNGDIKPAMMVDLPVEIQAITVGN